MLTTCPSCSWPASRTLAAAGFVVNEVTCRLRAAMPRRCPPAFAELPTLPLCSLSRFLILQIYWRTNGTDYSGCHAVRRIRLGCTGAIFESHAHARQGAN